MGRRCLRHSMEDGAWDSLNRGRWEMNDSRRI